MTGQRERSGVAVQDRAGSATGGRPTPAKGGRTAAKGARPASAARARRRAGGPAGKALELARALPAAFVTVAREIPGAVAGRYRALRADAVARPEHAVRVLGVAVVVLALLAGLSWFGAHRHDETVQARVDATAAAKRSVGKLLSYNFRSVDRQLESTHDLVTGQFGSDYAQLVQGSILPNAKDKRAVVRVAVLKSSVVSSGPDEVELLVFITQQSQTLGNPDGDQADSTLRVTLLRQDDRWKVSELQPV